MYEYLTPFISGMVTVFGLVLFSFARTKKYAVSLQLTFIYLAVYYLLFLASHWTNFPLINALAMAIGFGEGPLVYWVVLTFAVGMRKGLSPIHWLPILISFFVFLANQTATQDTLYVIVSISRILYGLICASLLWGMRVDAKGSTWTAWLPLLVGYMIILAVIKIAAFTIYHMDNSWHAPDWVIFAKTTGAACVVLLLLWWALIKPAIFSETQSKEHLQVKSPTPFDVDTYERLIALFEKENITQKDDLNLAKVADHLAVSSRELSEAINKVAGVGFRALLRQYRIKNACEILASNEGKTITILEVAMQSGFASKSVFNEAFRTETGLTPTAYKLSQKAAA